MRQSPDAPDRMEGMVPGVRAGGFLFLSAVRGRDPKTGAMVEEPLAQARQALRNVETVLAASGATLAHVVKVTLYMHDLERRKEFHQAWMEFFPKDPPARIAVGVADANAAPGGKAHYALDVIALAPQSLPS
ncbi:MAG: RidA family protein [Xanthobacteraceae bacterium]|nr:RidA family protein [Xanthobacteraceae bacterium]